MHRPLRLLALCLLLLAADGATRPRDAATREPVRTIVLGCPEGAWPPYIIDRPEAEGRGILPDILADACAAWGVSVAMRPCPDKRCLAMVEDGTIDAYTKAREWVKRPERFAWSGPVVPSVDVVVFGADGPVPFSGPEDLVGLRLGTILGYGYPRLDAYFPHHVIIRDDAPDVEHQMLKLVGGRTDAAVVNRLVFRWVLRLHPEIPRDRLHQADTPLDTAWFRFVFTRARDLGPLIRDLDAELERMRADGRLDAILDRYR